MGVASGLVAPVALGDKTELFRRYGKSMVAQNFQLPNGTAAEFVYLDGNTVPVIIFAYTGEGKVIAVRQFRYPSQEFILELPGGCPNPESFEETVARELMEETGYRPATIQKLGGQMHFEPASHRTKYQPVFAGGCQKVGEPKLDETEVLQVEPYALRDWKEMVLNGTIADDKTIAVSVRAFRHMYLM